ncbi:MAG: phosphoribosyltransferase family protein [Chloroflexota bacterium]|nr:phosphoribosyltransferase family protein [Chloroflexota bacterium]
MSKLRIVSFSSEPFRDRREAGQLLGRELAALRGQRAVVLGIPRGGIIVARELARALDADLDIVLAHKLRTPGHPELAMGAVAEGGRLFLNESVVEGMSVNKAYIEQEKAEQMAEMARRTALIRRVLPKIPLKGRLAIVTDDGVATGATTQAALWAVRQEQPGRLIAALPVGAEATVRRLAEDVDEMVCLRTPPLFAAVGQFYLRFEPVEDDEVLSVLAEEQLRRNQAARSTESHVKG